MHGLLEDIFSFSMKAFIKVFTLCTRLTLCIQGTPKGVLLQTVKTKMKCNGKPDPQTKLYIFFNYNLTPLDMYNELSQVYYIKPEGRIY